MIEFVGNCDGCGKKVYCENGFLNGAHENGQLLCDTCSEEEQSDK